MTYKPIPIETSGGHKTAAVSDHDVEKILMEILEELRVIRIQITLVTELDVKHSEHI